MMKLGAGIGRRTILWAGPFALASARASAEPDQQKAAAVATISAGTHQAGVGMAASYDPIRWLRIQAGIGGWAFGAQSGQFETGSLGLRLASDAPPTMPAGRSSLFVTANLAHFYDNKDTDGYDGFRETTAAGGGLTLDYTYLGKSSTGFTFRFSTVALATLRQSGYDGYDRYLNDPYRRSVLGSLELGYSF